MHAPTGFYLTNGELATLLAAVRRSLLILADRADRESVAYAEALAVEAGRRGLETGVAA